MKLTVFVQLDTDTKTHVKDMVVEAKEYNTFFMLGLGSAAGDIIRNVLENARHEEYQAKMAKEEAEKKAKARAKAKEQ